MMLKFSSTVFPAIGSTIMHEPPGVNAALAACIHGICHVVQTVKEADQVEMPVRQLPCPLHLKGHSIGNSRVLRTFASGSIDFS